jgi:hypothetical protein
MARCVYPSPFYNTHHLAWAWPFGNANEMTIQFQNTPKDLREALYLVAREESRSSRTARLIFVVITVAALFIGSRLLNQQLGPSDRALFTMNSFIAGISIIVALSLVNIANIIRLHAWKNLWVVLVNLAIAGMLLGEWALVNTLTGGLIIASPTPSWLVMLPHIPWIGCIIFVWGLETFRKFQLQRMLWTNNPLLQRPKTAEIVATGITVSDDRARVEYQWTAFSKYRETKNLFVLFFGPSTYLMIPKRALRTTQELDAMRALATLILSVQAVGFPIGQTGEQTTTPPPLRAEHQT